MAVDDSDKLRFSDDDEKEVPLEMMNFVSYDDENSVKKRPLDDDCNSFHISAKKLKMNDDDDDEEDDIRRSAADKPFSKIRIQKFLLEELALVEESVEEIQRKRLIEEKRLQSLKRDIEECSKDLARKKLEFRCVIMVNKIHNKTLVKFDKCVGDLVVKEAQLYLIEDLIQEKEVELEIKEMELHQVESKTMDNIDKKRRTKEEELKAISMKTAERNKELESDRKMLQRVMLIRRFDQRVQMKDFESMNQQFENRIEKLESKEKQCERQREKHFEERFKELESKEKQLEGQVKYFESMKEELKGQIKKLKSKKKHSRSRVKKYISKEKHFEGKMKVLESKEKQFEGKLKVLDLKEKQYEGWLKEFESKEEGFEGRLKELESKIKHFENQVEELESKKKQFEECVMELKSKEKQLKCQVKELKPKIMHFERGAEDIKSKENHFERCKGLESKDNKFEVRATKLRSKQKQFEAQAMDLDSKQNIFNRQLKDVESREKQYEALMKVKTLEDQKESGNNQNNDTKVDLIESSDPSKVILDITQDPIIAGCRKEDSAVTIDRDHIIFLEQLMRISPAVKPHVREEALKLALAMKANMTENIENSFAVLDFLLIVSIYGLVSSFEKDEVFKKIGLVTQHKIAIKLFGTMGWRNSCADFVQNLIRKQQYIEAVTFICAYNLVDKFQLVDLL